MNKTEEYNRIVSNYKPLREKAWEQYQKILQQEQDSLIQMLDFKGKFIKICGEYDIPKYMYVEISFKHQTVSNNPIFILRGQGFTGFVSEFAEDTYMAWSEFFEHTIYINSLDKDIKEIEIITKEEYNEAFDKLLLEIKQEHYKNLK